MDFFPQKIQNKLTSNLKNVMKTAENISCELNHKTIGIEHIIFGIISQRGSVGSNALASEKVDLKNLRQLIENIPKTKEWKPKLSEEAKNALKKSVLVATRYRHTYIGTEHLLYAILAGENKRVMEIFSLLGLRADKLKEQLKVFMESRSRFSDIAEFFSESLGAQKISPMSLPGSGMAGGFMMEMPSINHAMASKQTALEYFCIELVEEFEKGKIDPIVGRDEEINKVINVLMRRTKNNPVLVGEPGVGKTAVVQGLAQKIFQGDVPAAIVNKKIYSLDMGLLVAGTVFRGEFEARLKDVVGEVQESPNAILFVDEIHTIIGAGNTGGSGSLDAANILKPSLSRGDISCIGATTLDEYKKHFKKDAALERRFQVVLVEEPSANDTKKMLNGLKGLYEKHHNLEISKEAIEAAVDLSVRFINNRYLPDKAFDILDEAASLVRSRFSGKNYFKEIKVFEEQRKNLRLEKEKAVESEKYDQALIIKEKEEEVEKSIKELYEIQEKENKTRIDIPVTVEDVAEIIMQMTGVPAKKMVSDERKHLKNLEKELGKYIIGQKEAIETISKSVRRNRSGVARSDRPIGIFLFLGPTGVGKTELAKVMAKVMYKNPKALIKIDMSEFMEKHNVSRLVGAPAGYIGYEEGGKLTEQVKTYPYSIILFDEVEKAHPDVFNLMLQIFEDGQLTDAAGRKVDFKNAVIIMTSNIGTDELTNEARWGFSDGGNKKIDENAIKNKIRKKYIETKDTILKELKNELRPEFVNRIDKIVVFNPLSFSDIKSIVKIQIGDLEKRLAENNKIKIIADKKVLDFIAQKSFNPNEGARLVRRNLQGMVEDLISEKIIEGEIKEGDSVELAMKRDKIVVKNRGLR